MTVSNVEKESRYRVEINAKAEYAKRVLSSALSRRVEVPLALK